MARAALVALPAKQTGDCKRRGDKLDLLPPSDTHSFLDAAITIGARRTLEQEISNSCRKSAF